MATAQPLPAPPGEIPQEAAAAGNAEEANPAQALVPIPQPPEADEEIAFSGPVSQLPVELEVAVPVREFRVRHLLALTPGQLVESQWSHGNDVPLAAGDVQLAWSEFEVMDNRLAVRMTRLAGEPSEE